MKKSLFLSLLLAALAFLTPPEASAQVHACFDMRIGKGLKRVMFTFEDNDGEWKKGTVQYKGQAGTIPIRFKSEKETRLLKGRPSERRLSFEELVNGKATGLYSFVLQGVNFYDGYYLRYKDRRKFRMEGVNGVYEDCFGQ